MSSDLTPFRRVDPTAGMMIGVDTWREAHDYHRQQLSRHHLALHGWGVVEGLQVTLVDGADNTLYIHPGLAIDSDGRFVVVPQPQTLKITTTERRTVFLVLQFRDVLADPSGNTPWQVVEAYRIQERERLPEEPYLELGRVEFDPGAGPVRLPANADAPGQNELDVRSRVEIGRPTSGGPVAPAPAPPPVVMATSDGLGAQVENLSQQLAALDQRLKTLSGEVASLGQAPTPAVAEGGDGRVEALMAQVQALARQVEALPQPSAVVVATTPAAPVAVSADRLTLRLAVAEHSASGWDAHREGLRLLARELSSCDGLEVRVVEPLRLAEASDVDVLYLSGHAAVSLNDADVDALRRLLEDGAAVIAEGCASGPGGEGGAREFALSIVDLANRLGRQLTRVDRGHPLLRARHVFGELPAGARPAARVLESAGLVYSDADYGCAWQGGPTDHPLARAIIRDAFDFGANLVLFRRGDR